jgi:hypothetical protein
MHAQSVMVVGAVETLLILDTEEVLVVICLLYCPTLTLPQVRVSWIARIKAPLFDWAHRLDDGVRRFDADPLIVNAWQRLQEGAQTSKDRQLLEHELFEARFEGIFQTDYRTAHEATNRSGRLSGLE